VIAKHSGADSLFAHRFFMRAGLALGQLFAWVLVFDYSLFVTNNFFESIAFVLVFYVFSHIVTFFLTPVSGGLLRFGFRRVMSYGALALVAGFFSLAISLQGLSPAFPMEFGVFTFAVFLGVYRALYWIPYGVGLASYHSARPFTRTYAELLIASLPLAAGILFLLPLGAVSVFLSAGVLVLMGLPFLGSVPDARERYAWGYVETYRKFFGKTYRKLVLTSILSGIESVALFLIWPLSVFLIIGERYDVLGAVIAATLLVLVVAKNLVHRAFTALRIQASPAIEASVRFSAWVMRLTAAGPAAVIAVDTYYYLASPRRHETPDAATFEQAGDSGTYVDELTALKELGIALGRVGGCFIALAFIASGTPAFVLAAPILAAALAALASVAISRTAPPSPAF
jgi:hypothetical protein